jgi:MFS family permease
MDSLANSKNCRYSRPFQTQVLKMRGFLTKFYIFRFFEAFKLVGIIFSLLFAAGGLNPFQISLLISIWSATQIICEVPFGVIADLYPRRNVLILAVFVFIAGMFLWLKGGFIFYALGFVFWGMKNALTSGTIEAFVYDELKSYGSESQYEKINGRADSVFWAGITLSTILGGMVAGINYNYVILATILTAFFTVIPLLLIKPVQNTRSTNESKYLATLKNALLEMKSNKILLKLTVLFCLMFALYGAADEFWPLFYKGLDFSPAMIGVILAAGYGIFALAGNTLHFFKNNETVLLISSSLLFISAGIINSPLSLPVIFLGLYLVKVAHLKFDAAFQHAIGSGERATVSSLKSLVFEIVYMAFVLTFGAVSNRYGLIWIVIVLGFLLFVLGIAFGLILKKLPIKND